MEGSSKVLVMHQIAMLSGLILVVFLICYCCHRNMNKNSSTRSPQYWQDSDVPLEIFTVDGQCYEVSGVFLPSNPSCASFDPTPVPPRVQVSSPPPAYETLIVSTKKEEEVVVPVHSAPVHQHEKSVPEEDDSGLPTYEAALRLEAQGYV